MPRFIPHTEPHFGDRISWLRAAVLGANDGIVSTASLIVGVAASKADAKTILIAGVSGLVAGALSMAAGEYVSVSSQADAEAGDLARERAELATDPAAELQELAGIYEARGLDRDLALKVAQQLTAKDALSAHARDELGITELSTARPVQAAVASAAAFAAGAALPLLTAIFAPQTQVVWMVSIASLISLAALGALGARAGNADVMTATARVTFWGALAMAVTAAIGSLTGVSL